MRSEKTFQTSLAELAPSGQQFIMLPVVLSLQQLTYNTVVAATLAATVPGIAAAAAIAGHSKTTD